MFILGNVCLSALGTYLGLDWGKGYLPSSWWGVPTFQLMGGTYLPADGGHLPSSQWEVPTLTWMGSTYLGLAGEVTTFQPIQGVPTFQLMGVSTLVWIWGTYLPADGGYLSFIWQGVLTFQPMGGLARVGTVPLSKVGTPNPCPWHDYLLRGGNYASCVLLFFFFLFIFILCFVKWKETINRCEPVEPLRHLFGVVIQ